MSRWAFRLWARPLMTRGIRPQHASVGRRHRSYLSPPFLLDEYIPRYHLLSSTDAAKKRSEAYAHLRNCNLCPRLCGVNRFEKTGVCLIGADVKVNTIAPHFGEGKSHLPIFDCFSDHLQNRAFKATMVLGPSSSLAVTCVASSVRTMILPTSEMDSILHPNNSQNGT
jgi:hypothetical protein